MVEGTGGEVVEGTGGKNEMTNVRNGMFSMTLYLLCVTSQLSLHKTQHISAIVSRQRTTSGTSNETKICHVLTEYSLVHPLRMVDAQQWVQEKLDVGLEL